MTIIMIATGRVRAEGTGIITMTEIEIGTIIVTPTVVTIDVKGVPCLPTKIPETTTEKEDRELAHVAGLREGEKTTAVTILQQAEIGERDVITLLLVEVESQ